jgi:hypothetical protein
MLHKDSPKRNNSQMKIFITQDFLVLKQKVSRVKILNQSIISIFILSLSLLTSNTLKAQSNPNISPIWDSYYDSHPSGIRGNYQASDFIRIIENVNFIPNRNLFEKDQQLLKKLLLRLPQEGVNQLSITGDYYSRTKKHDDYFTLYNLVYKPISKDLWDRICPYLIPLMDLDYTIKLHN